MTSESEPVNDGKEQIAGPRQSCGCGSGTFHIREKGRALRLFCTECGEHVQTTSMSDPLMWERTMDLDQ